MPDIRIPRLARFCTIDSNQDTVFQSPLCLAELIPVPLPSRFLSRESVLENVVISPVREGCKEPGRPSVMATCTPL